MILPDVFLWKRQLDRIEKLIKDNHKSIMSAISDFAARVAAFNATIDKAIDGLVADIADLKAQIEKLQQSAGQITPEDQALLDEIEARANGISNALEALDAQTEQAPPPPPEV